MLCNLMRWSLISAIHIKFAVRLELHSTPHYTNNHLNINIQDILTCVILKLLNYSCRVLQNSLNYWFKSNLEPYIMH